MPGVYLVATFCGILIALVLLAMGDDYEGHD